MIEDARDDERRWLTVEEAGALAGISRSAAYDAVNRGDIPSIRVGRLIRVPRKKWIAILDGDHLSPHAERPDQEAGPSEEHS